MVGLGQEVVESCFEFGYFGFGHVGDLDFIFITPTEFQIQLFNLGGAENLKELLQLINIDDDVTLPIIIPKLLQRRAFNDIKKLVTKFSSTTS